MNSGRVHDAVFFDVSSECRADLRVAPNHEGHVNNVGEIDFLDHWLVKERRSVSVYRLRFQESRWITFSRFISEQVDFLNILLSL